MSAGAPTAKGATAVTAAPVPQRVLHAFFELDVAPPGFNVLNFLVLADIAREELDLDAIHVVFVPGTSDGFRDSDIEYDAVNKAWRLRQICIAATCLLPSCSGHTLCDSRGHAADLAARAGHVFPFGYGLDKPMGCHDYSRIVEAAAAGHRIDRLRATAQARGYVRDWLRQVAGERRVVTITLRESSYDLHRSSTNANWAALAREMQADGFCPVVVRDTERVFTPDADFDGLPAFPHAAVNLELRAALYAEAYLNTGINQGPFTLWHFLESVPYLCVYIVDRMYDDWHAYHIDGSGFTVGADMPFARGCQVTYWGDDHLDDLRREFAAIVARLEAGEHRRAEPEADPPVRVDRLALGRRYQENGQAEHALALYQAVQADDPDNAHARVFVGLACIDLGRYQDARAALEPLTGMMAGEAWFSEQLAGVYVALGCEPEALALLQPALQDHPQEPGLHRCLGDLHLRGGRPAEAADSYRQALALKGDSVTLMPSLATALLQAGDAGQAIMLATSVLKRGQATPALLDVLAQALLAAGRSDQAAACYRICADLQAGRPADLEVVADALKDIWEAAA